ncbi:MAG: toxic anion resistance protein [Methanosphaera stadtmanae]|nr:toxic anion resistance protein [Methanosphaera stadtmanae]
MAEFSLDIDDIEEDVEKTLEEEKSNLPTEKIQTQAKNNAIAIFEIDLDDVNQRESIIKSIENFGVDPINKSTEKNQALLNTQLKNYTEGGTESKNVSDKLLELNKQVKELDPSNVDWANNGIMSKFFDPVKRYFEKYETAETVIANIIKSLDQSNRVLKNDNVTLLSEESNLREVTKKLMTDIELGKQMDASIEAQIEEAKIKGIEQEKIDIVSEEILYPLRQRIMDMQQMIVINQQGIVSLNVVRRNNKELIRGINRAKNVTVTALRTGIMVASSLYNQKIAIDKINILNSTTEDIISSTTKIIREQGNQIQKLSTETAISPEVLQTSFKEALAAIEDISTFKQEALPKMQETINTFNNIAIEGQKAIDKINTKDD